MDQKISRKTEEKIFWKARAVQRATAKGKILVDCLKLDRSTRFERSMCEGVRLGFPKTVWLIGDCFGIE